MTADFEALVRAHQAAVCGTAYAVLRDRARSEEVAQDAFLIAWRKLPTISPAPPLPAWICGIARNLARNAARKSTETAMDSPPELAASTTPLDDALSREKLDVANRALATLAEIDREIVVLYYRGDESIASVATALGISDATARQRLHRSRERLRAAVASVEAALRATRPTTAFTAACVAALAAGAAPADAEAAPYLAASSISPIIVGFVVMVAIGGAALGVRAFVSRASTSSSTSSSSASSPIPTMDSRARTGMLGRISARERAAFLDRLRAARARNPAPEPKEKVYDFADAFLDDISIPDPPPTGPLSKSTLRYAIKLIQPLLLECLTDPDTRGKLRVRMYLEGDESATVVENVEITGDAPLSDDAELVACVTTTLSTLELPPMPSTERWIVDYPFVLAP